MHEQLIVSTSERLERANRLEAVADSAVLEYQDKQVDTRTGGSLVDHAGRTAGNLWALARAETEGDLILVAGSLYAVSEVRRKLV